MASLERRYDGRYRIIFYYAGQRFKHSLGNVSDKSVDRGLRCDHFRG